VITLTLTLTLTLSLSLSRTPALALPSQVLELVKAGVLTQAEAEEVVGIEPNP
jgi:hypothetical protein